MIKTAAPKSGVDSQYVMKLQSQLAKAMKKMELEEQKAEMQKTYEEQILKNQEEMERLKKVAVEKESTPDLETELEEAENKLEALNQTHGTQEQTIEELKASLEEAKKQQGES